MVTAVIVHAMITTRTVIPALRAMVSRLESVVLAMSGGIFPRGARVNRQSKTPCARTIFVATIKVGVELCAVSRNGA